MKRFIRDESGLTLIELTIVIVILGILATFIAPRLMDMPQKAKVSKAGLELNSIRTSLDMYAIDVGQYPTSEQGLSVLYEPQNLVSKNWNGPYTHKNDFRDAWGNDYVCLLYTSPSPRD